MLPPTVCSAICQMWDGRTVHTYAPWPCQLIGNSQHCFPLGMEVLMRRSQNVKRETWHCCFSQNPTKDGWNAYLCKEASLQRDNLVCQSFLVNVMWSTKELCLMLFKKNQTNNQQKEKKKKQLSKTWENSKNVHMAHVLIIYGGIWTLIKTEILS